MKSNLLNLFLRTTVLSGVFMAITESGTICVNSTEVGQLLNFNMAME